VRRNLGTSGARPRKAEERAFTNLIAFHLLRPFSIEAAAFGATEQIVPTQNTWAKYPPRPALCAPISVAELPERQFSDHGHPFREYRCMNIG
jgi:hypothetical protein